MTQADATLTTDQTQAYWRDGFLFPLNVMSADEAAQWRAEFQRIEQDWTDSDLPRPLNTYKKINAHCVMPMAYQVAMDPRILDAVEPILGPDILIYAVEFFVKEPQTRHIVTMHQDLTYWGLGEIDGLVTAWLALSPATPASGCMDFVAGSHKNPILPHEDTFSDTILLSRGQEIKVDVPDEDKVAIELQPGQMSLHHGLTIHGSGANRTDDRRIGLVIRYCRPEIAQQVADRDYAMLARGADRHGNFTLMAPPETLFAPRSLALYEEVMKAELAAKMAGAKEKKGVYAG
jgi:hypothetical protein